MEYFCDMCLSTWKRVRDGELNHFMQPCSTCDGMMTWGKDVRESARRVLEVWGYAVENVDRVYVCEPNVYVRRIPFRGQRVQFQHLEVKPEAFRAQQERFLSSYITTGRKEDWDLLHPSVQWLIAS